MFAFARQFQESARRAAADIVRRSRVRASLQKFEIKRDLRRTEFRDYEGARQAAAEIKWEAINHLDSCLEELSAKLEARGTHVHWASTGKQACEIVLAIAREKQARAIVKSKTMTAEEIHLNEALEAGGLEVVETDLGEFIMQLRREPPYHIVSPSMHLSRGEVSDLFQKEFGGPPTEDPEELTMVARRVLRERYVAADIGITGANFAIAETGMIVVVENEGNARLTAALPRTMISLLGIEKVIPRLEDLALFLPLLASAGGGQSITCYNSLYGGPRQADEADGPEEYHVILLDNHRTRLLADPEQRDALHCIRCGACLNVCPIFRNIGGPAYGTAYSGPIGSVITPHLRGLRDWRHLSAASSLCGACTEACPVKIDLHHHLLRNRRNAAVEEPIWWERLGWKAFALLMNHLRLYSIAQRLARLGRVLLSPIEGSRLDPFRAWTETRSFPSFAARTFKDQWREWRESRTGNFSETTWICNAPVGTAVPSGPTTVFARLSSEEKKSADSSRERTTYSLRAALVDSTLAGRLGTAVPTRFAWIGRFTRCQTPVSFAPRKARSHFVLSTDNAQLSSFEKEIFEIRTTIEKDKILSRIREALKLPSPRPGANQTLATDSAPRRSDGQSFREWLPAAGVTFEEQVTQFRTHAEALHADFQLFDDLDSMLAKLAAIARAENWRRMASHRGDLADAACGKLELPVLLTDTPYDKTDLEKCDAGISECDCLVAQTGSLFVTAKSAGGRALSVLPPHHVVVARREQLLPDLPAAFAALKQKYEGKYPSFIGLITGPSRTGDIERVMVLGAHGPRKLTILCY